MERDNQNRKDEQQDELNQHLNDTAPGGEVSTDISAVLSKATAYERAVGRIKDLIVKLRKERKGDLEDKSFEIVSTYLHVALNHCVGECDKAWEKVYASQDFGYGNYEKLNNAVMLQAALDYEKDICSGSASSRSDMEDIERFAESGDSHTYSGIDFANVLKRIRDVAPEFQRIVRTTDSQKRRTAAPCAEEVCTTTANPTGTCTESNALGAVWRVGTMPKKAIEGCVCGEGGVGSECRYNRHGRCQWCGFNEKVHERRKYLLKHDGLTQFKNGLWGLKLPPWEVIS